MKMSALQRRWCFGALTCLLLAVIAAVLTDLLLAQWNPTLNLSAFGTTSPLSERSLETLADTTGTISVECIFPSESTAALPVGRLVRAFAQASRELAGADFDITYVDPRMEPGAAAQLVAQGATGVGILFRQDGRSIFLPEHVLVTSEGIYDPTDAENAIASAMARLSRQDGVVVGWLTGHGEPELNATNPLTGISGLQRALENEGCRVREIQLDVTQGATEAIPEDVKVLLVVNPRYPVTAAERVALSDWLERGGRLFCALPATTDVGLEALLERWGIRVGTLPRRPVKRILGDWGLATHLSSQHPVTCELAGKTQIALCAPRELIFERVRGISLTPLVSMDVAPLQETASTASTLVQVMVAAERGAVVDPELGFQPGRIIVIGDAAFTENRHILNHASANRDLAVNAIRWLTGLDGSGARSGTAVFVTGLDLKSWQVNFIIVALGVPFVLCLLLWVLGRRRA